MAEDNPKFKKEKKQEPKVEVVDVFVASKKEIDKVKCRTPKQAYKIFKGVQNYEEYELKNQEHFWVMGIDIYGYITCVYITAMGSENRLIVDPSDIFGMAIAKNSKEIVLAHNKPNLIGELKPTAIDLDMTNRFYHACLPFGLNVIDHILIADNIYYSMKENGDMKLLMEAIKYKQYNKIEARIIEEREKYGEHKLYEGRHEGRIEGEHNKAVAITIKMLKKDTPIKDIIELTDLTESEIKSIKQAIGK